MSQPQRNGHERGSGSRHGSAHGIDDQYDVEMGLRRTQSTASMGSTAPLVPRETIQAPPPSYQYTFRDNAQYNTTFEQMEYQEDPNGSRNRFRQSVDRGAHQCSDACLRPCRWVSQHPGETLLYCAFASCGAWVIMSAVEWARKHDEGSKSARDLHVSSDAYQMHGSPPISTAYAHYFDPDEQLAGGSLEVLVDETKGSTEEESGRDERGEVLTREDSRTASDMATELRRRRGKGKEQRRG